MSTCRRLGLVLCCLVILGCSSVVAAEEPVVVELFTSQGCSNCPAAEALLRELSTSDEWGATIIPLAYHVDYWNNLGWADPFSQEAWTYRQQVYAQRLQVGVYTPQVVVNGQQVMVGSNRSKITQAIDEQSASPAIAKLQLTLPETIDAGAVLPISLTVDLAEPYRRGELHVMVALFESGFVTDVGAGENARRTLENDHVVRQLLRALIIPTGGSQYSGRLAIRLNAEYDLDRMGLVAFVQNPQSLAILGASARRLRSSHHRSR